METNIILLTPIEVSKLFFAGQKSTAAVLNAARRGLIPSVRIGRRVYFSREKLTDFFATEMEKSIKKTTVKKDGITKID